MVVAYAKLYELILKKVKGEKEAEEICKIVEEVIKEYEKRIEQKFKDERVRNSFLVFVAYNTNINISLLLNIYVSR